MKKWIGFLLLLIAPVWALSAFAADQESRKITVEIPIYSQKIRFSIPFEWQYAFTDQNASNYLVEFIPKTETIENWTHLFTLQGIKNYDPEVKLIDIANQTASKFVKICPDNAVYTPIGQQKIHHHNAFSAIIGCANMPNNAATKLKVGMSEISHFIFVRGKKDLYIIQKSIRSNAFENTSFPSHIEVAIADMKNFFPIELCNLNSPRGQCLN